MSRGSLTRRLVLSASLWLLLALGVGGVALASALRESVRAGFDARLEGLLLACTAALRIDAEGKVGLERALGDPRFEQVFSGWYWQASDAAGVAAASRSLWDATLEAPGESGWQTSAAFELRGPRGEPLRALARNITLPGREDQLWIVLAGETSELRGEVERFEVWLLASLASLATVLVATVVVQVRFGLEPLRRLSSDLERIRTGGLESLPEDQPSELEPLVRSLHALLDDNAEIVRRSRTQVGNLAHALKTPLSLIVAEAGELADARGESIRRHAEAMQRQIEHRLVRAASAGASGPFAARVRIADVALAIASSLRRLYPDLLVEIFAPPDLVLRGEREDFEEIVGNLLENACKWAARRVRLTARSLEAGCLLEVDDDGPGRSEAELERALQRGIRLDERVPGYGLGLSIVQDVVDLYGGEVRLGASELGGVRATIRFPGPSQGRLGGRA
jgi:signal transduction histidine kinase